ncbi:MAG TPA: hypothetical protein VH255_00810 [Verrucomicrobiae bacterium]|nr:hypothetical protein [Verrucomicrobiae bacterium]
MSKRKIYLWAGLFVVLAAAGAAYFFFFWEKQVIKFSDDAKLTLLAVQYGTHHVPPTVKATTGTRTRRATAITTTNDTLVLWILQEPNSKDWHNFQYYVYDKDGEACVQSYGSGSGRGENEVIGIPLRAFPRRQSKFYVRVEENSNGNNETAEKKFVIRNPARGPFPNWVPDSVPVTKDDDDVSVTLTKVAAGAQMPYNRNDSDSDDAMNKGVQVAYHVERSGAPVTNWKPVNIITTDATGNNINGYVNPNGGNQKDDGTITYQWGLWPDEAAWKIRMEFSQQSDFANYELWTLQNIPVKSGKQQDFYNNTARNSKTNQAVADTVLNGVHLTIFPVVQFTDVSPNSQPQGGFTIQADPPDMNGLRMTLTLTDDHADTIEYWNYGTSRTGTATTYRYGLRDMMDATNVTVSIALHKSRFVEFTVKPEKAATTDQQQNQP